jgi:uncharacterized protein (UPF0335 family)
MKIHPNKQAAQEAVEKYIEEVERLEIELGVKEELGDSDAGIFLKAIYYTEDGKTEIYYA